MASSAAHKKISSETPDYGVRSMSGKKFFAPFYSRLVAAGRAGLRLRTYTLPPYVQMGMASSPCPITLVVQLSRALVIVLEGRR